MTHEPIGALTSEVYRLQLRDDGDGVALTPEWLADEQRQFDASGEAMRLDSVSMRAIEVRKFPPSNID